MAKGALTPKSRTRHVLIAIEELSAAVQRFITQTILPENTQFHFFRGNASQLQSPPFRIESGRLFLEQTPVDQIILGTRSSRTHVPEICKLITSKPEQNHVLVLSSLPTSEGVPTNWETFIADVYSAVGSVAAVNRALRRRVDRPKEIATEIASEFASRSELILSMRGVLKQWKQETAERGLESYWLWFASQIEQYSATDVEPVTDIIDPATTALQAVCYRFNRTQQFLLPPAYGRVKPGVFSMPSSPSFRIEIRPGVLIAILALVFRDQFGLTHHEISEELMKVDRIDTSPRKYRFSFPGSQLFGDRGKKDQPMSYLEANGIQVDQKGETSSFELNAWNANTPTRTRQS